MRRFLGAALAAAAIAGIGSVKAPALPATSGPSNPGFEVDANHNGVPDCWQLTGDGTNSTKWSRTTDAHSGGYAARIVVSAYTSGGREVVSRLGTTGCAPAATPGHTYRLSTWYKGTVAPRFQVFARSAGAWQPWVSGPALPAAAAWQSTSWVTPAVPAGVDAISFGLAAHSTGTLITDDVAVDDATSAPAPAPQPEPTPSPSPTSLLSDSFSAPDGLITNEYAFWNPTSTSAVVSPLWEMTSGSLFNRTGAAWSGNPDANEPNATSTTGNNSAIFRLTSKRSDLGNVAVSFRLRNDALVSTSATPAVAWDGIHVFLRYQSEESLYYASINRRDNVAVIKKKVPGGPSNGGTYYQLAQAAHPVPYGSWQNVRATVQNEAGGAVTIRLYAEGQLVVQATDNGSIGGAPITKPGKTGIRGDNCNFQFDDFTVDPV